MSKKIMVMSFDSESKAFQAFSEIKTLHTTGKIKGEQMAVVQHVPNHILEPKDFIDFTGRDKSIKGSLIGMIIGILGGPLGVLLGWFTGSMVGSAGDVREVKGALSIFEETLKLIPEGSTGAILIAEEEKTGHLDELVNESLAGKIIRLDRTLVEEEISEASKLEKETQEQAKKRWFSRKEN